MGERSSIGEKRLEYLDLANKSIAGRDFGGAELHVDNFITTIPDNIAAAKDIQKCFDDIEKEKQENFVKIIKDTEELNMWVQTEQRANMRDFFVVKSIKDRVEACWNIALKNGLFND